MCIGSENQTCAVRWLRVHNRLYANIPLDESAINLHPKDGYLPRIEDGPTTANLTRKTLTGKRLQECLNIPP